MIEIQALCVKKQGSAICEVGELHVEAGTRLLVEGSNGCGKTTLLRVLAGFQSDFEGTCRVDVAIRDRVFVHQSPLLFRGTVMSNATYGLLAWGQSQAAAQRIALQWLELFGMADLIAADVERLSGGEQRRVALARAFALQPKLLLLDEPSADLDGSGEQALSHAIQEATDSTIVMASPQDGRSYEILQLSQRFKMS